MYIQDIKECIDHIITLAKGGGGRIMNIFPLISLMFCKDLQLVLFLFSIIMTVTYEKKFKREFF